MSEQVERLARQIADDQNWNADRTERSDTYFEVRECHRAEARRRLGIEPDLTLLTDYRALLRWLSQDENSATCESHS